MERPWDRAMATVALGAALVVAASGVYLVWRYQPVFRGPPRPATRGHEWALVAMVAAGLAAAVGVAGWPLARRVVIVVAVVGTAATWPFARWDQLGLWAVTLDLPLLGFWDAAFADDIRFVLVRNMELSQATYRIVAGLHVGLPFVMAAAVAAGRRWRLPSRSGGGNTPENGHFPPPERGEGSGGTIGDVASTTVRFNAAVLREDGWFVARCLDVDVASQGLTVDEALANLRTALELYFEDEPVPRIATEPIVAQVEVDIPHHR